jgi:hypothetical protein
LVLPVSDDAAMALQLVMDVKVDIYHNYLSLPQYQSTNPARNNVFMTMLEFYYCLHVAHVTVAKSDDAILSVQLSESNLSPKLHHLKPIFCPKHFCKFFMGVPFAALQPIFPSLS